MCIWNAVWVGEGTFLKDVCKATEYIQSQAKETRDFKKVSIKKTKSRHWRIKPMKAKVKKSLKTNR